mmetsp:Transcript_36785/g.57522  ORF Transcript_36785/g.57522 Transcript_36785/m.57522 type:complete len:271 (+) Transcript_36785:1-813(+)
MQLRETESVSSTSSSWISTELLELRIADENEIDFFINYRVRSDKDTAEKLCYRLLACQPPATVFWDKKDLKPGAPWCEGFTRGLKNSTYMLALISREAVSKIKSLQEGKQDNVLLEYELAVDRLEKDPHFILPIHVGEYTTPATLTKFKDFNPHNYPNHKSGSCQHRTIRETMSRLFAIQGIPLDPQDLQPCVDRIMGILDRGYQPPAAVAPADQDNPATTDAPAQSPHEAVASDKPKEPLKLVVGGSSDGDNAQATSTDTPSSGCCTVS